MANRVMFFGSFISTVPSSATLASISAPFVVLLQPQQSSQWQRLYFSVQVTKRSFGAQRSRPFAAYSPMRRICSPCVTGR